MTFEQNPTVKTYKKINPVEVNQNVQTKVEIEGLKTVLSADAKAYVTRNEYDGENLTAYGTALFKVLYLNEENNFAYETKNVDFTFTQKMPNANYFQFTAKEYETTVESVGQNEYVLTSKLGFTVNALSSTNIAGVKPNTNEVIEKTNHVALQTIEALAEDKLSVTYETELAANSVLLNDAVVTINNATATDDAVLVDGELWINVLTEIDGNLKQTYKQIEFSGEVNALGLKPNATVNLNATLEDVSVALSNNGTNATLQISAVVALKGECYQNTDVEFVEDAFSENNELIVSTEGQTIYSVLDGKYKQKELGVVLQTKDKQVNMGTILAIVSPKYENQNLTCTVIYRHAETDEVMATGMLAQVDDLEDGANVIIKSFAKKRSKEVLVELEATLKTYTQEEQFITYASTIEEGAAYDEEPKGIVLYAAQKGQDLFDVAKALKVKPELLKEQNENLEDKLQENRKIIYYKPVKKQF